MMLKLALIISSAIVLTANGLRCWECDNASSNKECLEKGKVTVCDKNEGSCQSTVRVSNGKTMLFKTCKQTQACKSNMRQNGPIGALWLPVQCSMHPHQMVCRCCCSTNRCNDQALACRGSQQKYNLMALERDLHFCGNPLCSNHGRCYKGELGYRCACNAGHEGDKCQHRTQDTKNKKPTHVKLGVQNDDFVIRLMKDEAGHPRLVAKSTKKEPEAIKQESGYQQAPAARLADARPLVARRTNPQPRSRITNPQPRSPITTNPQPRSRSSRIKAAAKALMKKEEEYIKNIDPVKRQGYVQELIIENKESADLIRNNKDLQDLLIRNKNALGFTSIKRSSETLELPPSLPIPFMEDTNQRRTRDPILGPTALEMALDIDECSLRNGMGNCIHATGCENLIGDFICHCIKGYMGRLCEESIEEHNREGHVHIDV